MIKKYTLVLFPLPLLLAFTLLASCRNDYSGSSVNVAIISGRKNDKFSVYLDGKYRAGLTIMRDEYGPRFFNPGGRLFRFSTDKDSVLITVWVNERDTSFYIHPKAVKEVYIGATVYYNFMAYINFVEGGLRPSLGCANGY